MAHGFILILISAPNSLKTVKKNIFNEIASITHILVSNEEDFQFGLGIEGSESGGKDLSAKIECFKTIIDIFKKKFPNVSVFDTKQCQVINVNSHMLSVIMMESDNWLVVKPRQITVPDRIGGGDKCELQFLLNTQELKYYDKC
jgi:2-dehydro-3-deoxygluconokinase